MSQPKRPWWQVTNTVKWSFILGGLWAFIAVARWWELVSDWRDGSLAALTVILVVVTTLLAAMYLVSGIRLRRRSTRSGQ